MLYWYDNYDYMVGRPYGGLKEKRVRTNNKLNPQNGTQLQSNQGHIGGTWALSQLHHPCFQKSNFK